MVETETWDTTVVMLSLPTSWVLAFLSRERGNESARVCVYVCIIWLSSVIYIYIYIWRWQKWIDGFHLRFHYGGKKQEKTSNILETDSVSVVLPHSSASGWECWVEASAHKPPSSSPPLMDLTEQGRSRATGSPHECLTENMGLYYVEIVCMHVLSLSDHAFFLHPYRYWCVNISINNCSSLAPFIHHSLH